MPPLPPLFTALLQRDSCTSIHLQSRISEMMINIVTSPLTVNGGKLFWGNFVWVRVRVCVRGTISERFKYLHVRTHSHTYTYIEASKSFPLLTLFNKYICIYLYLYFSLSKSLSRACTPDPVFMSYAAAADRRHNGQHICLSFDRQSVAHTIVTSDRSLSQSVKVRSNPRRSRPRATQSQ